MLVLNSGENILKLKLPTLAITDLNKAEFWYTKSDPDPPKQALIALYQANAYDMLGDTKKAATKRALANKLNNSVSMDSFLYKYFKPLCGVKISS